MTCAVIRPVRSTDAAQLAVLYAQNRDFLRPFEPERDERLFTEPGQRERVESAIEGAQMGMQFRFVIIDAEAQIAGVIGLENVVRGASQSATLGYWVDRERNGRGLATRAVADMIDLAWSELRLHRLQAPVLVGNRASQRVLVKNGFEQIGVARSFLCVGGAWRDHILFQRVVPELSRLP